MAGWRPPQDGWVMLCVPSMIRSGVFVSCIGGVRPNPSCPHSTAPKGFKFGTGDEREPVDGLAAQTRDKWRATEDVLFTS